MSTRGFSRRDLLQLGGKVVMTVGAAKIVVALPGCGDDGGGGIDAPPVDSPSSGYDAAYGYSLDDCTSLGTYQYDVPKPGYTYHYYYQTAYGCPYYLPYPYSGVYCYYMPDRIPGSDYFCFNGYYYNSTIP